MKEYLIANIASMLPLPDTISHSDKLLLRGLTLQKCGDNSFDAITSCGENLRFTLLGIGWESVFTKWYPKWHHMHRNGGNLYLEVVIRPAVAKS